MLEQSPSRDDRQPTHDEDGTSIDVLRYEDLELQDLLEQLHEVEEPLEIVDEPDRSASVLRRYQYRDLVRQVLRHLAIRQAAATDVAAAIRSVPDLRSTATEIIRRATACRPLINDVREMHRKVHMMSLNVAEEFDERLSDLIEMAADTIKWELSDAIPRIEQSVRSQASSPSFHSARYVRHHAPTRLNPRGPQWYERSPVISRWLTIYDHLLEVQL